MQLGVRAEVAAVSAQICEVADGARARRCVRCKNASYESQQATNPTWKSSRTSFQSVKTWAPWRTTAVASVGRRRGNDADIGWAAGSLQFDAKSTEGPSHRLDPGKNVCGRLLAVVRGSERLSKASLHGTKGAKNGKQALLI